MTVSTFPRSAAVLNEHASSWKAALDDPLLRALNHAVLIARRAVKSSITEIRLFTSLEDANPTIVAVPEPAEAGFVGDDWHPGRAYFCRSAREIVRPGHPFQPGSLQGPPEQTPSSGSRPAANALCVIQDVGSSHWMLLTFARDDTLGPFDRSDHATIKEISSAINDMVAAAIAPAGEQVERYVTSLGAEYGLTDAEVKVAGFLVGTTLSEQAVAGELHRSFNTIHRHVTNIYRKLNVRSRLEAMAMMDKHTGAMSGISSPRRNVRSLS
ncbi:MAG: helix-turn-helix transcriptional regulator [Phycisphaerales bacterium]|nr:helix-turn-helix transcriptional regulator [Phycisphaerales bacterium]